MPGFPLSVTQFKDKTSLIMTHHIRIGTRGSPLAQAQTDIVVAALRAAVPDLTAEAVIIETSGDWKPGEGEKPLLEKAGGKGQFAKEIEEHLIAGRIDCGVHSFKDMPAFLPDGLSIDHVMPGEDPRDTFISYKYKSLQDAPAGAVIGTSSLRRQAFLLAKRPDLKVVPFRGNVHKRLEKMKAGQVDGTFLALAGLRRVGLVHEATQILEPHDFLPACGQGVIAIEIRTDDDRMREILDKIHDYDTGLRMAAERIVLQILDGSCRSPIGVHATVSAAHMTLVAAVAELDGSSVYEDRIEGAVMTVAQAKALAEILAERLKARVPSVLLQK
jgi:hydroxymethylbilane synthase